MYIFSPALFKYLPIIAYRPLHDLAPIYIYICIYRYIYIYISLKL